MSPAPHAKQSHRSLAVGRILGRHGGWLLTTGLGLVAVATLVAVAWVWNSSLTVDQRVAALGDTFGAGATLAVLGSAVALLAYRISIQRPDLKPSLGSDHIEGQSINVGLGSPDANGERAIVRVPGFGRYGN